MEKSREIEAGQVGQVSAERYEQMVERARGLVASMSTAAFAIGDLALEIEPIQGPGGGIKDDPFGVEAVLERFADDIGLSFNTVKTYRWTAARWPAARRQEGVSFTIHKILASISDEARRWQLIKNPPLHEPSGCCRWTTDGASRAVGQKVETPFTVAEKVRAVHDLAADDQVAAKVATDLLHRPEVAFKAMADDTARQLVNRAQVDHAVAAIERQQEFLPPEQRLAVPPRQFQQCMEFIDLIGACALFVSSIGRVMPTLRGHTFSTDEKDAIAANLARVRATADWMENAVDTGNLTLDQALAELLGE